MYLVKIENDDKQVVIHAPDISELKLQTGIITNPVNAIPSFEFSMLPDNPGYASVNPLKTRIHVVRKDKQKLVFDGRVLNPTNDMSETGALTRSFVCEGALGYLHDGVPDYMTLTGTWIEIITKALADFNSNIEEWKKIQPGDITTSGSVTLKTSPESDWYDTLQKLIVTDNSYDWKIRTDENSNHFLDVKPQIGENKSSPRIELSHNIQAMTVEADPTNVISRVIPLGAVKETGNKGSTADDVQPRVNLGDIGKALYIDSPDLISTFGINAGTQVYDSIKNAADLEAKGEAYLQGERPVTTKYNIKALDLSTIGLDADDFEPYNFYPVINPLLEVNEPLRVTNQTIDIIAPEKAGLEIGDRMKRQSDFALDAVNSVRNIGQIKQMVAGQSARIELVNNNAQDAVKAAQEAQDNVVALKEVVKKLQTDLGNVDVVAINKSLTDMTDKLSVLSGNIDKLDKTVSDVKDAQTTATGATLETLEQRLKKLEDAAKPV
ncbi:phage tail protein [Lacticaseibacillus paracasei]|uniref:phage tail protein n=1 Tax=Lacticaseibacillus paracasei TaxID=1597 RepID=UPI00194FF2FA|nr:phage tail protein [Lacticaseibacillus paracasei]